MTTKRRIEETRAFQLAQIIGFQELDKISHVADSIYIRMESLTPSIQRIAGDKKAERARRALGGIHIKLSRFERHARRCTIAKQALTENFEKVAKRNHVSQRTVSRSLMQISYKDLTDFFDQ
jgi:hypothetical protein